MNFSHSQIFLTLKFETRLTLKMKLLVKLTDKMGIKKQVR